VKDKSANFFATGIRELGHDGVEFTLNKRFPPSSVKIKIPLLGLHNVYNALASVATTQEFSLPLEDIREALLTLKPSPLRMELIEVEGITIINDTYNANPTSMKSAINTLISLPCRGRRVVVMGDMLELGDAGGAFHEEIGVVIKEAGVDFLFTFGELASFTAIRAEAEGFPRERLFKFATKEVMVKHLLTLLQPGDIILVKGSRAMKLEEVVDMLRIRLERR
jgi:UDP-N-acetylmuramoyl-tripeptide--D-alanyl-D-alanine ligase